MVNSPFANPVVVGHFRAQTTAVDEQRWGAFDAKFRGS